MTCQQLTAIISGPKHLEVPLLIPLDITTSAQ